MSTAPLLLVVAGLSSLLGVGPAAAQDRETLYLDKLDVTPAPIASDKSVKYDFDIVYVRAPRKGDAERSVWADISHPAIMDASADLMLLHPDGSEELLVAGGEEGAILDPFVSFDGKSVYYSHLRGLKGTSQHGQPPHGGADIFRIDLATRKIDRLTHQEYTPNLGSGDWSSDFRTAEQNKNYYHYGVLNLGCSPLPGGRLVFVSNRNGFIPPKHSSPCLQLFVMDEDGKNVECIGHLNVGMALHPVALADGRIMFSTQEAQGLRSSIHWGIWTIHPDGTNWGPLVSALLPGEGAPNAFHFQTQLSDGSVIVEEYYNQNNSGFGTLLKLPPSAKEGYAAFGPANMRTDRNPPLRFGRHYNGKGQYARHPFTPYGMDSFTKFTHPNDNEAGVSDLNDKTSPQVGKFTHPCAAPDNHLLTVWSPGPANHVHKLRLPAIDAGIYLIKSGEAIEQPGEMLLVKNDPRYNEQWPRPVVSYQRVYGIAEPKQLAPLANDGQLSPHLPAGTPYGLVGTSSFYKRESYPNGIVPPGSVTATWDQQSDRTGGFAELDPFNTSENGASLNWVNQGSDAGRYDNDEIHAVRILAMEPTTHRPRGPNSGRRFHNHAHERLRILGEIPLRKFQGNDQPVDPDGHPDTSFLAKIPADVPFTFQTLDKDGMVLNMAQTWHQLRPGEVRHDCGGCHAHSQEPTRFEETAAAKADYRLFDLTEKAPLLTSKKLDELGKKWDAADETGVRLVDGVQNVEYHRDIQPILARSCVACHSGKSDKPAGNLVLDDDEPRQINYVGKVPGTYVRLAEDSKAEFGHKPVIHNGSWRQSNASRYIRKFQSRRSLLVWKIYGRRTDGWSNEDFPTARIPGDAESLELAGQPVENTTANRNRADLDFHGSVMPPAAAVAAGKVAPLTDEDRRTLVRWIDLGCPIDLDYGREDANRPEYGWQGDDTRPTLAITWPVRGANASLERIVVGATDYFTGLEPGSLHVTADVAIDGLPAGTNLAEKMQTTSPGVWELKLQQPLRKLPQATITASVKDRQGSETRLVRTFSVK